MVLELNFLTWNRYNEPGYFFVYCIETKSIGNSNINLEEAIKECIKKCQWEFEERFTCDNLKRWGWKVSEHELIPPNINIDNAIKERKENLYKIGYPKDFNYFGSFKKEVIIT